MKPPNRPRKPSKVRVHVTDVVNRDTRRVLYGGTRPDGSRVTFAVTGSNAAALADKILAGEEVYADLG